MYFGYSAFAKLRLQVFQKISLAYDGLFVYKISLANINVADTNVQFSFWLILLSKS